MVGIDVGSTEGLSEGFALGLRLGPKDGYVCQNNLYDEITFNLTMNYFQQSSDYRNCRKRMLLTFTDATEEG